MVSISIKVQKSSLPLMRSAIKRELSILNRKAELYKKTLEGFEERHKMTSGKFIETFEAGKLGDDEEWFRWEASYRMYLDVKSEVTEAKRSLNAFLD